MADQYLNKTGLSYLVGRLKTIFVPKNAFDDLSDRVDDLVAEGGEPNKIDTVKVNGTALVPDTQKAVDVAVPTSTSELTNDGDGNSEFATEAYVDEYGGKIDSIKVNGTEQAIVAKSVDIPVPTKVSELTNDGDGTTGSQYSTKAYVDEHGGKIDVIKVNGTAQAIVSKAVDIPVPTKTSDLTNDSTYQTEQQVTDAIDAAIAGVSQFEYEVVDALPATGEKGTIYLIPDPVDEGQYDEYIWVDNMWNEIGETGQIDLSDYWAKSELTAITTAEIDAITA